MKVINKKIKYDSETKIAKNVSELEMANITFCCDLQESCFV